MSQQADGTTEGDSVRVEDHGAVRVLTLDRPRRRNAIDLEMRVVLAERVEEAMGDAAVRVIVLTGAGGTFCSGGDISTMRRQSPEQARSRAEAAQRIVRAIWSGPKPVLAAVEGFAYGAGAALAFACDQVIAASDATFNLTFTRVGLAGDLGIFWSLRRRAGLAAARRLLMLPRPVGGVEAVDLGLADVLTEPGAALAGALDEAAKLAAGPPLALAAIKAMLVEGPSDPYEVLAREIDNQVRLFDTDDFAEGVAAFHERRPPLFRGR